MTANEQDEVRLLVRDRCDCCLHSKAGPDRLIGCSLPYAMGVRPNQFTSSRAFLSSHPKHCDLVLLTESPDCPAFYRGIRQ